MHVSNVPSCFSALHLIGRRDVVLVDLDGIVGLAVWRNVIVAVLCAKWRRHKEIRQRLGLAVKLDNLLVRKDNLPDWIYRNAIEIIKQTYLAPPTQRDSVHVHYINYMATSPRIMHAFEGTVHQMRRGGSRTRVP